MIDGDYSLGLIKGGQELSGASLLAIENWPAGEGSPLNEA